MRLAWNEPPPVEREPEHGRRRRTAWPLGGVACAPNLARDSVDELRRRRVTARHERAVPPAEHLVL